jgi:hypothetical protein
MGGLIAHDQAPWKVGENAACSLSPHSVCESKGFPQEEHQMANDDYKMPVSRPQGGTKLDTTFPDGLGSPSNDKPPMKSPQPVKIPTSFTRKKK